MSLFGFILNKKSSKTLKQKLEDLGSRGKVSLYFVLKCYGKKKGPIPLYKVYRFLEKYHQPHMGVGFHNDLVTEGFVTYNSKMIPVSVELTSYTKKQRINILKALEKEVK